METYSNHKCFDYFGHSIKNLCCNYQRKLQIYETLFQKPIDKVKSFMCGDALGRPSEHSDCDLKFAEAIGIKILSPEELFPFEENPNASTSQEMIIMIGMPGSGKSHFPELCYYRR